MCAIDWGIIAAWLGTVATVGLVIAAFIGLGEWKSQFLKARDHDVARRILNVVSNSKVIFHELRTPHALFSDADEPVAPPIDGEPDGAYEHRKMYARYKARSRHLVNLRNERTAALFEAMALWDDTNYAASLGELINQLELMETAVLDEAVNLVDNLTPRQGDADDAKVDNKVLFRPMDDVNVADLAADAYEAVINAIAKHLKPKIRLD